MLRRRARWLAIVAYLTQGQGVNRTRFRNDIDDAIFSTLDDDFFQPGAQSWKRTEWESSVTGEHPTREQTRNLPLCNVTCDRVFNESAFVFTPNREQKRGQSYDTLGGKMCPFLRADYHTAPGCLQNAGLPRTEHFEWSLKSALAPEPTCRLHDWSPAEAARAWLSRQDGRSVSGNVTVLLLGSSFYRQVFEAIGCRWREELTGGFLGAPESKPEGKTRPIADVLAKNGSCVGKYPDPTRPEWNPLTHGGYLPVQNSITCVDSYSCLEFSKRGVTLRLCYSFYGLAFLQEGQELGDEWAYCRAGFTLEDVDFIFAARPAAHLEDDIAKLRAATSCRRRPGEALALPPILRMGLAGFLTHINHISGRVVEEAQKAATAQRPRSHNATGPPETWADNARWRGVPVRASEPGAIMRASPKFCDRFDGHSRLPGQPDHGAKVLLALLASGSRDARCCDPALVEIHGPDLC